MDINSKSLFVNLAKSIFNLVNDSYSFYGPIILTHYSIVGGLDNFYYGCSNFGWSDCIEDIDDEDVLFEFF